LLADRPGQGQNPGRKQARKNKGNPSGGAHGHAFTRPFRPQQSQNPEF
jgi:hypothetical protein